jgi:aryl-alcohol dehydrogenase-like predicted oxidoreductase
MNKLALGTVQFGLDYGITNQNGQVSIIEVENILQMAEDSGIDTLDTASAYGNGEEVLGRVGVDNFQIVTKTASLNGGVNEVIKRFHQSLNNLNKANVDGLLIHDIDEVDYKQFDALFSRLNELKKEGMVNKIGFSTYTPGQIDFLLKNYDFDLIQVPFNVFDNRLIQGGQLKALNNKGIEVHARSVFLQGLLLDFKNLPGYFSTWKKEFNDYQEIVKDSGLSLIEYALNFAINTQEIDKVLVGVNSKKQLTEIIQVVNEQSNLDAYSINDLDLLNPGLWKI